MGWILTWRSIFNFIHLHFIYFMSYFVYYQVLMCCFVNSFFVFIVNPILFFKKYGYVLPIVYSHALQWNGKYFNLRTNFCHFLSQCICIGRILPTYLLQIFCSYAFREWWTLILFLEAFLYIFFFFFSNNII